MSIIITKAMPEDAEELIEFTKVVGKETDNLSFGKEGLPITVEEECDYISSLLNSSSSIMLVAKKDGKIVGNANFRGNTRDRLKHRGELGISVVRSEWGTGVSKMLMEGIIDFAKNTAKADIISLEVKSDNIRAIKLYEKYGFEKIGQFKGFMKIDGEFIDYDFMNLYLK